MTTAAAPLAPKTALHVSLWVLQALLALAFGFSGFLKAVTPEADLLAQGMAWIKDTGVVWGARVPGAFEVLGALGLVLPAATRVQPWLTPLAAAGLATIMLLATSMHLVRGEMIAPTLVLGALAAVVAWGRVKVRPIAPRA